MGMATLSRVITCWHVWVEVTPDLIWRVTNFFGTIMRHFTYRIRFDERWKRDEKKGCIQETEWKMKCWQQQNSSIRMNKEMQSISHPHSFEVCSKRNKDSFKWNELIRKFNPPPPGKEGPYLPQNGIDWTPQHVRVNYYLTQTLFSTLVLIALTALYLHCIQWLPDCQLRPCFMACGWITNVF